MSRINQHNTVSGTYKVVDSPKVGTFFLCILGSILWTYILIRDGKDINLLILSIPVIILSFLLFNANRKGFIGNVENDTLEYPGGGIAPDSFLSYFSSIYWLQYIRRFTLKISDIQQLDKYNKTKTCTNSQGKSSTSKQYLIDID